MKNKKEILGFIKEDKVIRDIDYSKDAVKIMKKELLKRVE